MIGLARFTGVLWMIALIFWTFAFLNWLNGLPWGPVMIGGWISCIGAGLLERYLWTHPKKVAAKFLGDLCSRIQHGDDEHRAWLQARCRAFEEDLERIIR